MMPEYPMYEGIRPILEAGMKLGKALANGYAEETDEELTGLVEPPVDEEATAGADAGAAVTAEAAEAAAR
jgi:hypothetical protein